MRKTIPVILFSVLVVTCAAQEVSKDFKKAALRCSAALASMYNSAIVQEPDDKYNPLELEASRYLTDAKIEADSPQEKNIYKLLFAWFELASVTRTFDLKAQIRDSVTFDRYAQGALQCSFEVRTLIDPDSVRESEKKKDRKINCMDADAAMHGDLKK